MSYGATNIYHIYIYTIINNKQQNITKTKKYFSPLYLYLLILDFLSIYLFAIYIFKK